MKTIEELEKQIELLRKAARLIHERPGMISGGAAMAECDEICKAAGLDVWTWPVVNKK